MNIGEEHIYSKVPDEMIIEIPGPENINDMTDNLAYLDHLTNHQSNERTLTPAARCADCSMKTCKNCTIMATYKSFAAYSAYKRIQESMKVITINGQKKIQCWY